MNFKSHSAACLQTRRRMRYNTKENPAVKRQRKSRIGTILLALCFLAGLSLVLYPSFSNYWNSVYSTHAISVYSARTKELSESEFKEIWEQAKDYNESLFGMKDRCLQKEDYIKAYDSALNIDGSGIMGYIEIPSLKITLPIAHGTSDEVLKKGVGHLEWTSLPTGGPNTHCVLSSHRGLPSAKLFTDLDKLREGDTFDLMILDSTLTYEVDQIRTVLPDETDELQIIRGKDYCTLVTCTPYGINTHRLLVRGHRIENVKGEARAVSEAVIIDELIVASIVAFPILFILFLAVMLKKPEKKTEHVGKHV